MDRSSLWECLSRKGVPPKYINILRALYSNTVGCVRVYGELSPQVSITSGVRQGCPASPFLFNFAIDDILEFALQNDTDGVQLLPGNRLRDLEYADDIVLLGDQLQALQVILDRLTSSASCYGMAFAPTKCKVLLQDWTAQAPVLSIGNETLELTEKFVYLGSCISPSGLTEESLSRIGKARAAFAALRHLWRRHDIHLALKGRVYSATVRSVLLYGCETWSTRKEDLQRLSVFDHRCLRSIAGVWWEQRISNEEVRRRVFGEGKPGTAGESVISRQQLRWLGHVLRMPAQTSPSRPVWTNR